MTLAHDEAMKTMTIGEVKRRITLTDDQPRTDIEKHDEDDWSKKTKKNASEIYALTGNGQGMVEVPGGLVLKTDVIQLYQNEVVIS